LHYLGTINIYPRYRVEGSFAIVWVIPSGN